MNFQDCTNQLTAAKITAEDIAEAVRRGATASPAPV